MIHEARPFQIGVGGGQQSRDLRGIETAAVHLIKSDHGRAAGPGIRSAQTLGRTPRIADFNECIGQRVLQCAVRRGELAESF